MTTARVESLSYIFHPGEDISYDDNAPPVHLETSDFDATLDGKALTVTPKVDLASEDAARALVEPFLEQWAVKAALESGRPEFHFTFSGATTAHADGRRTLSSSLEMNVRMHAHLTRGTLPPPPSGPPFVVSGVVQSLFARWTAYAQSGEKLPGMAYYCLTVIEETFSAGKGSRRDTAAAALSVDIKVLRKLGELTVQGDPSEARKHSSSSRPLPDHERQWLEMAVRKLIIRTGEVIAAGGAAGLPVITMTDLPAL